MKHVNIFYVSVILVISSLVRMDLFNSEVFEILTEILLHSIHNNSMYNNKFWMEYEIHPNTYNDCNFLIGKRKVNNQVVAGRIVKN